MERKSVNIPQGIFKTVEVAHIWAHQSASSGRNPQSNFYFDRDVIYSYGSHFPIARLIPVRNTKLVEQVLGGPFQHIVLMTTRTFSNMTAKHIHATRQACSHLPVFHVANVLAEKGIFKEFRDQAKEQWEIVLKKRGAKLGAIHVYDRILEEANKYAQLFGLASRLKRPDDYEEQLQLAHRFNEAQHQRNETRIENQRIRHEEQQRIAKLAFDEKLPLWLAGKISTQQLPRSGLSPIYIRLSSDGRTVETSWGAEVPLKEAVSLYRLAKDCRRTASALDRLHGDGNSKSIDTGVTGALVPIKVGGYQLDSIDHRGNVKIGCHRLTWESMHELARKVLTDETDDSPATGQAQAPASK